MVRAPASAILSLLLLAPCAATLSAEEASHQRLSVEGRESFDLLLGTAATLTSSDSSGNAGIEIDQTVSLDILFHRRFGISFELPAFAWAATERDAVPQAIGTLGDPNITATYSFRVSDWRLGAGLSYTYPLGIWNEYEAAERRIASGSGYHKIGFAFSAIRYLDPIVAGASMTGETSFGRRERFGYASKPLCLRANFFATEALNDLAAFSVGIVNKLSSPRYFEGVPDKAGYAYSLSGNASIILSGERHSLKIGVSRILSDYSSPASLEIGYSYTFKNKEPVDAR